NDSPEIIQRLSPLDEIGLGYVRLGQASSTLSGGEAQRVKLASFLIKEKSNGHIFFIFDEPTTGLHFEDVRKLLLAIDKLIDKGHSVLIIEHNIEVLKCADYLIDIGPGGGIHGGKILYQGVPEGIKKISESYTAAYLPF
ncbi:MAG TPA: excinuclease ABC subunit A, partial [Saprospiraceae bacterium]|nr:excinuclease ABC subunit A [Saprospiraceae bacterium]